MKIGIDAKWYFEGPPSGKVVIRNLVEILITMYPQHEFVLFLDKNYAHQIFPIQKQNVKLEYLWSRINLISNVFLLPFVASRHQLDCLVVFNFASPFGNYKKITFIFDVIFDSNPEHFTLIERFYFKPIRFLAKYSNRLCTISYNEKNRMIKYGYGNNNNIDVVYIGVNKTFRPAQTYSDETITKVKQKYDLPIKYFLYVGRLNDRKNLKNLIESLPKLSHTNIPLLLFGSYDWKSINLDEIVLQNKLQNQVIRKGFADQEDLPIIYSLATVFTFVSYEEGFGLPILEAMASGVPCIVADTPVFRELFTDSVVYADPNDPNDIARQLESLVSNDLLYKLCQTKGLDRADKFSWEQSTNSLIRSIEKL